MGEAGFYRTLVVFWLAAAAVPLVLLFFVTAPYGRHLRRGWGPSVSATVGWILMETPALHVFATCWLLGGRPQTAATVALGGMWLLHYAHRSLVYPLRLRGRAAPVPLSVVAMGLLFNTVNGYLQGSHLGRLGPPYPGSWLVDPRFVVGGTLYSGGLAANLHSDDLLLRLRRSGGYQIPHGGLFRWVSCPNYLGEIVEWCGWAVATWSLPGLAFAVWTAANLVPRAVAHHRWYRQRFAAQYPAERRAVIPFVL